MLTFHAIGDWTRGQVRLDWVGSTGRRIDPEVERVIDDTWARVNSRPGVHLFDGPMSRLESLRATPEALCLTLSPTSYRPFVGTNLENPHLADEFGPDVMANPVGVSTLLETADGFLMLGRRNASVAYYPGRVHPFAGALEPRDGADPFAAVYRELHEELSLGPDDLTDLRCCGLVEDHALRQPELVFLARAAASQRGLAARLDPAEHNAAWFVELAQAGQASRDPSLTPVAVAALRLWGRERTGANGSNI